MKLNDLKQRKIAVAGLGTNNRKLVEYLRNNQIKFEVIEWRSYKELAQKLNNFDLIFRTPGLPYLLTAIQQAKLRGAEISSQTKLFFELCPAPIIGVTGTKGKGTTSSLLAAMLKSAGRTVWLGGNIGLDPFEFLDQVRPTDVVILELSSFQLQDLQKSPHVAVVLNITSDHLDHHESVEEYIQAKSAILTYQTEHDYAVLDPRLPDWFKNLGSAKKVFFTPSEASGFDTSLLGQHNRENIAAAATAAKVLGISQTIIHQAVAEFKALPHHLEIIGTFDGITYIDDAVSTNIEPTIAAIEAVGGPLILIVGGHDKGLNFDPLGKKIVAANNLKALVVIGEVTDKISRVVGGFRGKILTGAKTMKEILSQARSVAVGGDTILISPATDSFDMFQNMYDRAEQFVQEVKHLP